MNIRNMLLSDYDCIYKLWISCKGMGLNNLDDSEEGISRFLARNPDTCFVAEKNSEIVGVIIAGSDGRRGYIYHTAVHPAYRKKGIATQLVDAALSALKSTGINKASLVVFERNTAGNAFWEKIGFPVREDLVYRDKCLTEIIRFDT